MAPESNRVIFGSYNRKDSARVARIAADLAEWGIPLWLDTSLRPGEEFTSTLEAQIAKADAAIVFVGADGPGHFQRLEISLLVNNRAKDKLPALIPVLLEGATGENAGGLLGIFQHVDFRAKANDPLKQLVAAIGRAQVQPANSVQNGPPDAASAHPLVKWFVREMTDPVEIKWFARHYVNTSQWPEALYIYGHLLTLALDRRRLRDFAKACINIGKIYVSSKNTDLAERQWTLAFSVYRKYFPKKMELLKGHLLLSAKDLPDVCTWIQHNCDVEPRRVRVE